jgi:Double-GTPase 1
MNLNVLMSGVAESGKTTFLAALWELMNSGEATTAALQLREDPADRQYFFEIGQEWLNFKELGHSNIAAPTHTEMALRDRAGREFELRIPDIVGERFAEAWEGKDWPAQVTEIARASDALLLFLHGGHVTPPIRLPPGEAISGAQSEGTAEALPEWDPRKAPTQTMLADLLEGVRDLCGLLPTVVIVSAWDQITERVQVTPEAWLQLNLPLLWQMLEGYAQQSPYTVFGVSAQGGDVSDPKERARLAAVKPTHDRIIVQHGEMVSSDISAPISWLLDHPK